MITKDITKQPNSRQSNFELLRIVAMFFIVLYHLGVHSNYSAEMLHSWKGIFVGAYTTLGKTGVNIFVLISGYFTVTSKFNWKRILKLELQILFYSLAIYAIFVLSGAEAFSWYELLKCALPIIFEEYWFMTSYMIMYLLSPLINLLLKKLSPNVHLILAILLILFQVPFSTAIHFRYISTVLWFVTLYILAAYLRLHNEHFRRNPYWIWATMCATCAVTVVMHYVKGHSLFWNYSGLCLTFAFAMFILFRKIKIGNVKWINIVAEGTLGVYLIHDNLSVRPWIWNKLLNCPMHGELNIFPLFALIAVLAIYVVCTAIDLARKYLLEGPFFKLISKIQFHKKPNQSAPEN